MKCEWRGCDIYVQYGQRHSLRYNIQRLLSPNMTIEQHDPSQGFAVQCQCLKIVWMRMPAANQVHSFNTGWQPAGFLTEDDMRNMNEMKGRNQKMEIVGGMIIMGNGRTLRKTKKGLNFVHHEYHPAGTAH